MTGTGLRSGQVATAAGVNRETLRYYERRGLVAPAERTLGGHRLYPAETVTVLRVIKSAQRLGFTLTEVAELLDTGRHRHGPPDARLAERARTKLAEIEARIAALQQVADRLRAVAAAGCDDPVACAAGRVPCPVPFDTLAEA
jgi:DNA-binding transcriptional MerR regulator